MDGLPAAMGSVPHEDLGHTLCRQGSITLHGSNWNLLILPRSGRGRLR